MNHQWVDLDIREDVVDFVETVAVRTIKTRGQLTGLIGIRQNKYSAWKSMHNVPPVHNGIVPKDHWLLPEERLAIIAYAKAHPGEGYRRLTYMMLDEDVVAVSPSSTYRVLKQEGLLNKWNVTKRSLKGTGFVQPQAPHQHWHTDIKYVNFKGSFLFLVSVIDGFSRFIVHHELRTNMRELDVQLVLQQALEKFPDCKPRIISDNGSQFISRDFAAFLKFKGLEHVRTSVAYPQSNGKIERFHRTINQEHLKVASHIDLEDAKLQVDKFISFYNTKRLHSSLFYLTPLDFLSGSVDDKLRLRDQKLSQAKMKRELARA